MSTVRSDCPKQLDYRRREIDFERDKHADDGKRCSYSHGTGTISKGPVVRHRSRRTSVAISCTPAPAHRTETDADSEDDTIRCAATTRYPFHRLQYCACLRSRNSACRRRTRSPDRPRFIARFDIASSSASGHWQFSSRQRSPARHLKGVAVDVPPSVKSRVEGETDQSSRFSSGVWDCKDLRSSRIDFYTTSSYSPSRRWAVLRSV